LTRQKAPLDLIAAFAELHGQHAGAELVLVGEGPLRGVVEEAIARAGLAARVHLLGLRRDIADILRAFDVFALASHWEGLPRVVPQAMAAGLPVVATHTGGIDDAVRDGETGWLVAPGDTRALAARLLDLARSPEQAREMGGRASERVEEFSARRMVDQLAELYAECVARKGKRAPAGAR
jgi:glycosyltransferase involved in cell wall biosynthesis